MAEEIRLARIGEADIEIVRKLHQIILPINYDNLFYRKLLEAGDYSQLAYYNNIAAGAIVCRTDFAIRRLYICTIICLAPYRRKGIGSALLTKALNLAKEDKKYDSVFLHVQIDNDAAISFYKSFGFQIKGTIEKYFRNLNPPDAYVLEKWLNENDDSVQHQEQPIQDQGAQQS